ncbi:hypothetical protein BS78_03G187300 [Paspalum vaginatum]|nr:hypothetical protein BS78_03G187300 [Paspalum vaginatum]
MATTAAPCSCSPAAALLPFSASLRSLSSSRSPPPSRVSLFASSKPRTPAPRFRVSYRPRGLVVSACSSGEVSSDAAPSPTEATIDLKLPRRSLLVQFTCNACGERTKRLINRVAYERGTVFLQMLTSTRHERRRISSPGLRNPLKVRSWGWCVLSMVRHGAA